MPSEKEFKVNEYITLKLEGGKTNIYVKDQLFNQCKFLLLNIPVEKISTFDEIESIDEAAEKLERSLEGSRMVEFEITLEVEFWGHCSNIQIWEEMNYDTRLLHSNLSFPLLKRLSEVGDIKAKTVFKEEIIKRFNSGNPTIRQYLLNEEYLSYLDKNALYILLSGILEDFDKKVIEIRGCITLDIYDIIIHEICQICLREVENCSCNRGKNTKLQMIIYLVIFNDSKMGNYITKFIGTLAEKLIGVKPEEIIKIKGTIEYEKFLEKKSFELQGRDMIIKGKAKFNDNSKMKKIILVSDYKFINISDESDDDVYTPNKEVKKDDIYDEDKADPLEEIMELLQMDDEDYEAYKSLGYHRIEYK